MVIPLSLMINCRMVDGAFTVDGSRLAAALLLSGLFWLANGRTTTDLA
jgi:hypothetical protein